MNKKIHAIFLLISSIFILSACRDADDATANWIEENLNLTSKMDLNHATGFSVDYVNDGSALICIDGADYYLYTQDVNLIPDNLPKSITPIVGPVNDVYVVGTGSMDFFLEADALSCVKYTSLQAKEWGLEEVRSAMERGDILYAGKYSAPDFEMLLSKGTDLIVENTMITHTPEVMEQLKNLGFSCIVDHSSYENTIEGRMEWIKLYGLLTGHLDEATASYEKKLAPIAKIGGSDSLDEKTICYFSITAAGTVSIRKKDDYICNMIRMAGGKYAFDSLDGIEGTGSATIQMESFYEIAKNCDIMIYNGTIEGEIQSIADLISKNDLLKNCKAVQEKQVYCTADSLYQSVMELGEITADFNDIINGSDELEYLLKLK